jgi:hypothetical protein
MLEMDTSILMAYIEQAKELAKDYDQPVAITEIKPDQVRQCHRDGRLSLIRVETPLWAICTEHCVNILLVVFPPKEVIE